jgi:hypothetical protein
MNNMVRYGLTNKQKKDIEKRKMAYRKALTLGQYGNACRSVEGIIKFIDKGASTVEKGELREFGIRAFRRIDDEERRYKRLTAFR